MREELRNQITNYTESVIESFGIHVPIYDIDRIVRDLGGEIVEGVTERWADGMLEPDKGRDNGFIIRISPLQSYERRKFTIAHELGHLFLHTNYVDSISLEHTPLNFEKYYRDGESQKEYEANEFAANLLMPQGIFRECIEKNVQNGYVDMKKVSEEFGVSVDAAITRGKWLGVLAW